MLNIPGKLRLMIDKNIRYGNGRFPIYFGVEDIHGEIHNLKELIFEEQPHIGCLGDSMFIDNECCQTVIDDLYRIGFRPSDEIKKDDLINTLKKEIEKRDKMIDQLMSQFVFKGNDVTGRKILAD